VLRITQQKAFAGSITVVFNVKHVREHERA